MGIPEGEGTWFPSDKIAGASQAEKLALVCHSLSLRSKNFLVFFFKGRTVPSDMFVHRRRLCAPKFSAVKQQPQYPGELRDPVKFYDAHITFSPPKHLFSVMREALPFCLVPLVGVLNFFTVNVSSSIALPVALVLSRLAARGRQNKVRPDLTGKFAVITGGTGGIGLETAKQLAGMGCSLLILSRRTLQDAQPSLDLIKKHLPKSESPPTVEYLQLDVGHFVAVRDFIRRYRLSINRPVDILINNAGVMHRKQVNNRHGDDDQLSTNFLGPFLLTEGLLNFVAQANGRIVFVASAAHVGVRANVAITYLSKKGSWHPSRAGQFDALEQYGFTKLGNMFHAMELAHRSYIARAKKGALTPKMKPVETLNRADSTAESRKELPQYTACSVHPGGVVTDIFRNTGYGWVFKRCRWICLIFLKSEFEGSQSVVNAAVREDIVNGGYYTNCRFDSNSMSETACSVVERRAVMDWAHQKMGPYLLWGDLKKEELPGTAPLPRGPAPVMVKDDNI